MSAFPCAEFESEQVAVKEMACPHCIASSKIQHASIVAGENDERVFAQALLLEAPGHFPYHPVQLLNEVAIELRITRPLKSLPGREGVVNMGRGQVEKERLLPVGSDPVYRFVRQDGSYRVVIVVLVSFHRSFEHIGSALRGLRRDFCDRCCVFMPPPAEINQRISRIAAYNAIILYVDIGRSTVNYR